jgi:tetratricopeptide (TPR) repeat protein
MIYTNYLPVIRILRMWHEPASALHGLLAAERFTEAAAAVREDICAGAPLESLADYWQTLGDLQLLIGDFEAAESAYEKSLALMEGKPLLSAMSCRATGLLMLVRGRLETSARCFVRNVQSPDLPTRLEALAICALLFREGGLLNESSSFVSSMLAQTKPDSLAGWRCLGQTIARDVDVYHELLGQSRLGDHVYWQAARNSRPPVAEPSPCVPGADVPQAVKTLLARRHLLLSQLLAVQRGERDAEALVEPESAKSRSWPSSAAWLARMNLQELALAALAAGQPQAASRLIARIPAQASGADVTSPVAGVVRPAQIEMAYCQAKSAMERGQPAEGLTLYRKYLKAAMETIRGLSTALNHLHESTSQFVPEPAAAPNGPEALLPQRYRRAYAYLIQHHARIDLSVHEVAASIGVSERALQMRFKSALGVTPREVIRQLRSGGANDG